MTNLHTEPSGPHHGKDGFIYYGCGTGMMNPKDNAYKDALVYSIRLPEGYTWAPTGKIIFIIPSPIAISSSMFPELAFLFQNDITGSLSELETGSLTPSDQGFPYGLTYDFIFEAHRKGDGEPLTNSHSYDLAFFNIVNNSKPGISKPFWLKLTGVTDPSGTPCDLSFKGPGIEFVAG
jgi:hypothetical protein